MKRIHLFEIEDQQWFPFFLRNHMTDFLQFLSNKTKIYRPIVPLLIEKLKATNTNQIIDIASGGGGGLLWLNEALKKEIPDLKIILTDYYPNIEAFQHIQKKATNIKYINESIDAKNVPKKLIGFRTQFLSFHHFKPKDAQQILQNSINLRSPIAIFEAQERSLQSIIGMLLSPITVLLTTPFIKPFQWSRIIFTYILPILPICILWDGLISCFRTYSISEMKQMQKQLKNQHTYDWEIGSKKEKNIKILYLIGTPKN